MTPDEPLTDDEVRARDAVRRLPPVPADPDFRARLRREFASGGGRGTGAARRWLLAASVLAVLGGGWLFTRESHWTVVATSASGVVDVDGRRVAVGDRAALAPLLVPGARVATDGEAEIQVLGGDVVVLVITPGSVTTLPGIPGGWFSRALRGTLETGEVRGVTGPGFAGEHLVYDLPRARVGVTGTTFAVLANAEGSCVCVLEGEVTMADAGTTSVAVPSGRRRTVPPSGGAAVEEEIRPMERMKLEMLRDQARAALR